MEQVQPFHSLIPSLQLLHKQPVKSDRLRSNEWKTFEKSVRAAENGYFSNCGIYRLIDFFFFFYMTVTLFKSIPDVLNIKLGKC